MKIKLRYIKNTILLIVVLSTLPIISFGQEIRSRVMLSYSEIQNPNRDFFNKMRQNIEEFLNDKTWTNHVFDEIERIEVSFNFRIKSQSSDNFDAELQIQATRPIYGTSYTSPLINLLDENVSFKYQEFETLEFIENGNTSNLTSVIAYYIYIILGLDYDSYQLQGGTEFFQKAQNIVSSSQTMAVKGWQSHENKTNRYWLVEDILNGSYSGFRTCYYSYHRLGLDIMTDKAKDGRAKIELALEELESVYKVRPSAYLLDFFFFAKKTELINIFSEAMPDEKQRVVALLKKINAGNSSDYDKINKK